MPIAPGAKPKPAEVASAIHDVEPTVMVYQSAVRNPHLLITSGQLPIERPACGTHPAADGWLVCKLRQRALADSHQLAAAGGHEVQPQEWRRLPSLFPMPWRRT